MRKSFTYPALKMLLRGRWSWISNQGLKYLAIKYLNHFWPNRIFVGPVMGVIVVSYRCNSRCPMCYLAKRGNKFKELSTEKMKEAIDEFAKLKTSGISFTGGEPLLRKDIFHLIRYANDKGMVTTLNTNALMLNEEKVEKLLDSQPDNVNVSLDAADNKTYDQIRGTKRGLEKLKKTVSLLAKRREERRSRISLTAITTVTPGNVNQLKDIARLAKNLGFDKIGFNPLHNTQGSFANKTIGCFSKELKDKDVYRLIKEVKGEKVKIDNTDCFLRMFNLAFQGKPFPLKCLAGYTSFFVDCFGEIYPCWPYVEMGKTCGNIETKKLSDIWKSKTYAKIRRRVRNCRDCFWNCQAELSIFFS